jgi:hypothetical protein
MNKRSTEKHQEKKSFERLRHKWEDNIRINLTERVCESMDWFQASEHNA